MFTSLTLNSEDPLGTEKPDFYVRHLGDHNDIDNVHNVDLITRLVAHEAYF